MFQRGALTLFRVRGVPVRVHWTLLLILPYLAFVLSAQFGQVSRTAGVPPEALTFPPAVWGVLLAVGLFASVLVHELAHTVLAMRYGGTVRGITLMLLGGVSQITRMPRKPRYEGLMAFAGPLTSLVLGALLLLLHRVVSGPPDLQMGLFYLGAMNLVLGVFNLLPAFPMDGGRILRAALAGRMGPLRATQAAARVGRVFAVALAVLGLFGGNLLLVLIGVFIFFGAGAEAESEQARAALEGLTARDLVPPIGPATIELDAPLSDAIPRMQAVARPELLVVGPRGEPVTVLHANDLAPVPPGLRMVTPVRELVPRLGDRVAAIPADASATDALERASERGARYLAIVDGYGAPVGLISAGDIGTMIALRLAETSGGPRPTYRAPAASRP